MVGSLAAGAGDFARHDRTSVKIKETWLSNSKNVIARRHRRRGDPHTQAREFLIPGLLRTPRPLAMTRKCGRFE